MKILIIEWASFGKEDIDDVLWSSIFVTLVAKKISCSGYATLASCGVA